MTKQSNDDQPITMYEALLLHSRADRALRLIIARALDKYDVTMMEWLLLGSVCEFAKDGASMSTVAKRLDVTLPQVTALAMGLTKSKLIKQKISKVDRRSRKMTCTPAAIKLLEQIENSVEESVLKLVSGIPRDVLMNHLQVLEAIADNDKPANQG